MTLRPGNGLSSSVNHRAANFAAAILVGIIVAPMTYGLIPLSVVDVMPIDATAAS